MNFTKRAAAITLAVLMLTAIFSGCVNKKPESSGNANGGKPVTGGDLTVALAQDLDDKLDPQATVSAATREMLFNVYEGLVKPDTTGTFQPAVAESFTISDSGDAFTFKLRRGIKFHNGNEVTAADVVYSLSRAAGLNTGEPLINGMEIVKSVAAANEGTITVTLKEPNVEALALMTAAIIPEGSDPAVDMTGTGPFRLVSRTPQESIVIEKFTDYWGTPAFVDKVTYKIFENGETIIMALMSGAADLCAHLTATQISELGEGFNVAEGTMNLVQAVYLNNAAAPFDSADVRRALSYALDKQSIMDFIADGKGAPVGSSMYPSFSKYFRADLVDFYKHDVEKAKQMLADAGYPDGFDMEITVPSNYTPHIDTATVIVEQLKLIGVKVSIKQVDFNTWLSDVYVGRDFQSTIIGVDTSILTARGMLERFTSAAGNNFINFSNTEYDEVFRQASTATSDAEQIRLYGRLQEILAEQAANLYIQDMCDFVVMQANVGGYEFYPLYVSDMSKVYFTE